ncbi:hypothetical protein LR48_Vigan2351s000100 [Vigna angularis]|nr:hypothetical protein LR48_Vigan2351s000100 [Vigna angularis]
MQRRIGFSIDKWKCCSRSTKARYIFTVSSGIGVDGQLEEKKTHHLSSFQGL